MSQALKATQHWLQETVIGFNFCPFAKKELVKKTIDYRVPQTSSQEDALYELLDVFTFMDENPEAETSLLIFEQGFRRFDEYLDLLELANGLLEKEDYEGIYQIASFHPSYIFDGVDEDDPSNYTNRSPFPILHILREESLERALANIDDPEAIPERNIKLAQELGRDVFEKILENSFHQSSND